jgi:hypothetical protein
VVVHENSAATRSFRRFHSLVSTTPISSLRARPRCHFERSHIVISSAARNLLANTTLSDFHRRVSALRPYTGSMSYAELTNVFKPIVSASAVKRLQESQPGAGFVFQIGSKLPNIQSANFTVRLERNEHSRHCSYRCLLRHRLRSGRPTRRKHCWCRTTTTRNTINKCSA